MLQKASELWIYLIAACVTGIFIGQWRRKRRKDELRSQPSAYDIESKITDLIDNALLETLTNKETKIILFKYSTSDIVGELSVCFSSTKKFSPPNALAEVFLNTIEGYEKFIDLRSQEIPGTILYADLLAMQAARALLKQAGLFQGTLQEGSQRSKQHAHQKHVSP